MTLSPEIIEWARQREEEERRREEENVLRIPLYEYTEQDIKEKEEEEKVKRGIINIDISTGEEI